MTREETILNEIDQANTAHKDNLMLIRKTAIKVFGEDYIQLKIADYKDLLKADRSEAAFRQLFANWKTRMYELTIYFPEIRITNTKKADHLIRDLFVQMRLSSDLKMYYEIFGTRTTFTADEWVSRYAHSHLPGIDKEFMRFCTGIGPINQVIAMLASSFNKINFEMLLLHIKNFVAWESIEGTPHRHISNIGSDEKVQVITSVGVLSTIYKLYIKDTTNAELKQRLVFDVKASGITVTPTEAFEKELATWLLTKIELGKIAVEGNHALVYKRANGDYCSINSTNEITPGKSLEGTWITFRKQEFKLKLEQPEEGKQFKRTHYANPYITKYICKRLSRELTIAVFRSQKAGAGSEAFNQQGVAGSNLLAV